MYFSHTHKGQPYNMPLLKAALDKRIRIIDYELMTDENHRRLVLFSKFAGYAGMIDCLHGLGHRLLALGYGTPFLSIGMSYMYRCLADARLDVTRTGQVIMDDGLPRQVGPMTFVFVGDGNVSKGAQHVFKCLPYEWVKPDDLKTLVESKDFDTHKVYASQVRIEDYIVHRESGGTPRNRQHYLTHPEEYESVFHTKIAPYTSVLINGIFWDQRYPRLLTSEQTRQLTASANPKTGHGPDFRMLSIADISCDINGSLEFMDRATTIDDPFFMYDPMTGTSHQNMEGAGVQIMSIDNLPTEMPLEASEYFSGALYPFLVQAVKGNFEHPVLSRATITGLDGRLLKKHEHLYKKIEEYAKPKTTVPHGQGAVVSAASKQVLLLGSGFVAAPLVDYLVRDRSSIAKDNVSVTIGEQKRNH
ncbi:hypothetical protein HK102_000142 [Quaeritorhiza haematococci]|nr:hypothetical protein HK102_000142 [Quaeritorhiza haematococci]